MPVPLNANELRLSMPTCLHALMFMVDVYICIAFVQPYQFDPESDPDREASEEVQTLRLQQDFSEWLVCLNNVSLFVCVVTVITV